MRAIAILAAIAMLISLLLPWLSPSLLSGGLSFSPLDLMRSLNPDLAALQNFIRSAPAELTVFLASFVLAALFLLLMLFSIPSRVLALIAGGSGFGLLLWCAVQLRNGALQLPGPLQPDFREPGQIFSLLNGTFASGAWVWALGTTLLFLAGLIGFARR